MEQVKVLVAVLFGLLSAQEVEVFNPSQEIGCSSPGGCGGQRAAHLRGASGQAPDVGRDNKTDLEVLDKLLQRGADVRCTGGYNPKFPRKDQDCRSTKHCCDAHLTCFEKDGTWAACLASCTPGLNHDELPYFQTPWSCRVLSGGSPAAPTGSPLPQPPAAPTTTAPATTSSPLPTAAPSPAPAPPAPRVGCSEAGGHSYRLEWEAKGRSFFDQFDFLQEDFNHGSAEYLGYDDAVQAGVVEAADTFAVLRAGPASTQYSTKRLSAKIATKQSWKYFLAVMKFSHVPWGCGVWPAFFTLASGVAWPDGGETDILEYVNDAPSQASFHTGWDNRCTLDSEEVNRCGSMPDANRASYNCYTKYPDNLGCAPNSGPLLGGQGWANRPGVLAIEWTAAFMKLFFIPESEIPPDLSSGAPRPDYWDRWLFSYYPFAASWRKNPQSCPNPAEVMSEQQLILNIGFCGDWASKIWKLSGSCYGQVGPAPNECRPVDPLHEYAPEEDCCTQFIWDKNGKYGTDKYLQDRAFFNISWLRVYQSGT